MVHVDIASIWYIWIRLLCWIFGVRAMTETGEIYIILSVTGPEIVDFTYYTELGEVLARVDDLNKLAGKREYWYITMYSNHRNKGEDNNEN